MDSWQVSDHLTVSRFFKTESLEKFDDIYGYLKSFKNLPSEDSAFERYTRDLNAIAGDQNTRSTVKDTINLILKKVSLKTFETELSRLKLNKEKNQAQDVVATTFLGLVVGGVKRAHPDNNPNSSSPSSPPSSSSSNLRPNQSRFSKKSTNLPLGRELKEVNNTESSSSTSNMFTTPMQQVEDSQHIQVGQDESTSDLEKLLYITPFVDLVSDLYRKFRFGHKPPVLEQSMISFPNDSQKQLYQYSKNILDKWEDADRIKRKNCLVALSGIINTIDSSWQEHFTMFNKIKEDCEIPGIFNGSSHQLEIFNTLKEVLERLRRYCMKRSIELEEQEESNNLLQEEEIDRLKEEWKIMRIMEVLCREIESNQTMERLSEHEVVYIWREISRILFEDCMSIRTGELSAEATRDNRIQVEEHFGGSESNAKIAESSQDTLQTQLCKNVRINAALANSVRTFVDADVPRRSPIILDIEGTNAMLYLVRRVEDGVFGAGVVSTQSIVLPTCVGDIPHFLDSGNICALLHIGSHNIEFTKMLQSAARKSFETFIHKKINGRLSSQENDPCIIFTPTKKQQKNQ
ncbi:hypothetical protein BGZ49_010588 [Haplosporangium sp. Z 27]|nr:hypothetical protein BGZ49_010588 [Haplosporangium sp. Z 27]